MYASADVVLTVSEKEADLLNDFVWIRVSLTRCVTARISLPISCRSTADAGSSASGASSIHRTSTRFGICARRFSRRSTRRFSRRIRSGSSVTSRTTPSVTSPARSKRAPCGMGAPLCFRTSRRQESLSSPSGTAPARSETCPGAWRRDAYGLDQHRRRGACCRTRGARPHSRRCGRVCSGGGVLLTDAELWARLARAGRSSVSKTNGRTLTQRKLSEALDVAFARPPNRRWTTPEESAQLVERLQEKLPGPRPRTPPARRDGNERAQRGSASRGAGDAR